MIVFYINKITDSLWPNGGPLTFKQGRKPEEKIHTREEANRKLSTWLPGKPYAHTHTHDLDSNNRFRFAWQYGWKTKCTKRCQKIIYCTSKQAIKPRLGLYVIR